MAVYVYYRAYITLTSVAFQLFHHRVDERHHALQAAAQLLIDQTYGALDAVTRVRLSDRTAHRARLTHFLLPRRCIFSARL